MCVDVNVFVSMSMLERGNKQTVGFYLHAGRIQKSATTLVWGFL